MGVTGGETLRALLIRHPWIDMILEGKKTWEMRGSRTSFRETIGLIASRSGTVIGVCDLVDCVGPLTEQELRDNAEKAGVLPSESSTRYRQTYAWVMDKPRMLQRPVPYVHPSGAVIWVKLHEQVALEVQEQLVVQPTHFGRRS